MALFSFFYHGFQFDCSFTSYCIACIADDTTCKHRGLVSSVTQASYCIVYFVAVNEEEFLAIMTGDT